MGKAHTRWVSETEWDCWSVLKRGSSMSEAEQTDTQIGWAVVHVDMVTSHRLAQSVVSQNPIQVSNVDTNWGHGRGAPERRSGTDEHSIHWGRQFTAPQNGGNPSLWFQMSNNVVADNRITTTGRLFGLLLAVPPWQQAQSWLADGSLHKKNNYLRCTHLL